MSDRYLRARNQPLPAKTAENKDCWWLASQIATTGIGLIDARYGVLVVLSEDSGRIVEFIPVVPGAFRPATLAGLFIVPLLIVRLLPGYKSPARPVLENA
jgi:hypothetical protein